MWHFLKLDQQSSQPSWSVVWPSLGNWEYCKHHLNLAVEQTFEDDGEIFVSAA